MVAVNLTKNLSVVDPALLLLLQQLQQLQMSEVVKSFLEENLLHSGKTVLLPFNRSSVER